MQRAETGRFLQVAILGIGIPCIGSDAWWPISCNPVISLALSVGTQVVSTTCYIPTNHPRRIANAYLPQAHRCSHARDRIRRRRAVDGGHDCNRRENRQAPLRLLRRPSDLLRAGNQDLLLADRRALAVGCGAACGVPRLCLGGWRRAGSGPVSYTHLRAHETPE